ncbi:hypothetical protein EMIHUDRAFT_217403 [Emiliania huxleyi CCMP1516]|uniref:Chromo domain-containing protein n=4 Tax=Emiliania huxleyi TaxID=2903 RepID=A0A0D3IBM4_EMIH1|nr:hypothetical protein EMIHUDRAFT_217403 [Emiliania huxleyi CCMP1516]EOD08659.1 hypothetical protein EMIHUDRAFT_217403 [Emiliania huxleyi CCMP1516]|eukprot:XP_005761088.1 hypothetical protein EMIHUDRAFT_217403 [Emiliania huxleyi CCMP1516]
MVPTAKKAPVASTMEVATPEDLHTSKEKLRGIGEATALFSEPARAEALSTLASLEGSPGPAAALARPVGGLLLIDAYALAMAGHESLAPTRALPALATPETKANFVKYKRRMTAYKADVERALKRRSTAVSRRKDPAEADRELDQLVRQAHLDVTAQLRAFAEGLHPRLGADSAVHLLEGCRDVLGLIAAEVRGAPPPRGRGTSQLRQVSLLLNYERRRRQLSEALADERRVELELAARRQQAAVDAALADERRRSAAAYAKLDAALQAERQETGRLCTEVRRLKAAAREAETAAELRCRSQEKEAAAHFGSIASEAERRAKVAEAQRDDACEEAAQLHGLFAQLEDQLDALRSMRVSGLLEQLQASTRRITELSARRKVTQRKLSDVNLVERNLAVSQRLLSEERAARASLWRGDATAEKLEAVEAQCAKLQAELEAAQAEAAKFKAIAEPTKARFKLGNHFNAETELACISVMHLGIARQKIPKLFPIFARLLGVKLPYREIKVPGPIVDGKRTSVVKRLPETPQATHCKELAGVSYELNKLQVGQWLLEFMNSDESSCCYIADGAEAQQMERIGTVLSRRVNGKLELRALDLSTASSKTAEAQASAYHESIEEVIKLMEEAGLADARAAELLRRFLPTCACNDRASTARLAARLVLGLGEGDDDPTCAEHALVNILEEGRKAMDAILRELMNFTDEQAAAHADKIKAMRTCVGWFSSPVSKYVALCSTKGYAIGRKLQEWMEARLADLEEQLEHLVGHVEDVLAICGSRAYVFYLDAAPTERLLTEHDISMLTYLDEDEMLKAAGGGKLRKSILTGARSPPCMAGVRAMALICDAVFWPLIRAVKPAADKHVLDVLPRVWPAAHAFFEAAAASPAGIVDGSLKLQLGDVSAAATAATAPTPTQARRAERHRLDMVRIRAAAADDPMVTRLLTAAFGAMSRAVCNHAAEWMPAGLVATNGSITKTGKLCSANITPALRAKYDALQATSTPVERLHAVGRVSDDRHKRQRNESRAGDSLGRFNNQAGWLTGEIDERGGLKVAETMLAACRKAAGRARRVTLKAQLVAAGRAKRAERDEKLGSKKARKAAKAAENARIAQLPLDQLKAFKLAGKTGFTVTQANRADYCTQLQNLLFAAHGVEANDLEDGDSGCDGDGVLNGWQWEASEKFDIERILDSKVETVGKGKKRVEMTYYLILWKGYPPDVSTWEPESEIHDDLIDAYEAELDAAWCESHLRA